MYKESKRNTNGLGPELGLRWGEVKGVKGLRRGKCQPGFGKLDLLEPK